ncbi:alpha/beta fold hydrolase [Aeromicrobium stalagmiti]|uniref:alpha/beta fold hydrolase n=1 Tax=Aeromicrobium stalagmiti TaxID=2738988 RepID=UPI0015683BCF|nr:alpha/beta hydrolase [Aeromicrobium stalagmiti]NRQ50255.1 alpha/beta fold hydrolase [Aeromicrobium stalagmiti]
MALPIIAHDRSGPRGSTPVLLIHAGVGDRRMWEPIWAGLTSSRDALRVDLRGFGESTSRPSVLDHVGDLRRLLASLDVPRCHVVGASYGAGIAVELALSDPGLVESLLLSAPGGSLIAEATPDLQAFFAAEGEALATDDLDRAVEANLAAWVDGPRRHDTAVSPDVRELVGRMQRRAFEITATWDDVAEAEVDLATVDRLDQVVAPMLVLSGALDLDALRATARQVARSVAHARLAEWSDVAHLPSMERPADFVALLAGWLDEQDSRDRR